MDHTTTRPRHAAMAAVAGLARQVDAIERDMAAVKQGMQHTASKRR